MNAPKLDNNEVSFTRTPNKRSQIVDLVKNFTFVLVVRWVGSARMKVSEMVRGSIRVVDHAGRRSGPEKLIHEQLWF